MNYIDAILLVGTVVAAFMAFLLAVGEGRAQESFGALAAMLGLLQLALRRYRIAKKLRP